MQCLIDNLSLLVFRQIQESLYEVTMDDLVKGSEVDLTLDTAAAEEFMTADGVDCQLLFLFYCHSDLERVFVSCDDRVGLVLTHLLLEGGKETMNGFSEEETA